MMQGGAAAMLAAGLRQQFAARLGLVWRSARAEEQTPCWAGRRRSADRRALRRGSRAMASTTRPAAMLMPATTWNAKRQPSSPSARCPPTAVAKNAPADAGPTLVSWVW